MVLVNTWVFILRRYKWHIHAGSWSLVNCLAGSLDEALYRVLMNINECGCRPYGWLGLDGNRCIRVIPRHIRFCQNFPKTAWNWKNLDRGGGADPPLLTSTPLPRSIDVRQTEIPFVANCIINSCNNCLLKLLVVSGTGLSIFVFHQLSKERLRSIHDNGYHTQIP